MFRKVAGQIPKKVTNREYPSPENFLRARKGSEANSGPFLFGFPLTNSLDAVKNSAALRIPSV
jgi:hypothetical protein